MDFIVLSLGTNLDDRENNLRQASELLIKKGVHVLRFSSIYETEPVGFRDQDNFLNQVLIIKTKRPPMKLLEVCLSIEKKMGRERTFKNAPRVIDIDILFYKNVIVEEQKITLPHPLIQERRFILQPLSEILAEEIHPLFAKTIKELLDDCNDRHIVETYFSNSKSKTQNSK